MAILAFCASAQDGAPLSESEKLTWSRFAAEWNRSQETNYTAEEMRATLPGVSTGDVAWVLAERRFNQDVLAESHWTPEQLLLHSPQLRLAGKAVGEVASISHFEWPETPGASLTEEELWSSLGDILRDDVAALRSPAVPFRELLWLRFAQDFDTRIWNESSMTADEMLSSPEYGLVRKIVADGLTTAAILNCIPEHGGVGPSFCTFIRNTILNFCEVLDAGCWIPAETCRREVAICKCKVYCNECTCNGGEAEDGSCTADCLDETNDCS